MAKKIEKNVNPLGKSEVVYMNIDDIQPNDYNPNRQSDRDFELLCRSIEEDGFTQPILVQRESHQIVDGEHRWRALKALGHTTAAVILTDFTKEQMMISTLRHNRARGNEDINKAADVFRELDALGALEGAADSLMLDDIELNIMIQDIPKSELTLRNPGEKLTVAEVEEKNAIEQAYQVQKKQEDADQSVVDRNHSSFVLTVLHGEKQLIEEVCGKKHVVGIMALADLYVNDSEALSYLDSTVPCEG